ncbi:hypothetical protein DNU06_01945 [Putridiphycobacter roseus]|uniref:Carboxypeptidase-like regulatory domain-containing protein n=1 Tax=Putridiphycobacter roseus TaxID=2219161 RepID=A0A2W1N2T0_9FLAO|nr:hypothetical protein [Putridiphycobacter roseus]PZE18617.1 hypothetical protein DNU06_01945 [Putridiphycobacter roseus]
MNRLLLLFSCLLIAFGTQAKSGILDKIISIKITETPIKTILKSIEEVGKVKFSYNPAYIDENKRVSISLYQKTIRYGLDQIFEGKLRFKEVGMHIVLLKKEVDASPKKKTHYKITGQIIDAATKRPIQDVSIYDIESKYAALSNEKGQFEFTIPLYYSEVSLFFSKAAYRTSIQIFKAENEGLVANISLAKKEADIEKIAPNETSAIPVTIEERTISGQIFSPVTYAHNQNLTELDETRIAQFSFLPSLSVGSQRGTNGLMSNNISINLLAGYAKGLYGVELGGIANVLKGDGLGLQVGGIANLSGGQFQGGQFSGILNVVRKEFNGIQAAGISNTVRGHFNGFQTGGIVNSVNGYFYGIQVAGIGNDVNGGLKGLQVAGLINAVSKDVFGLQVAGLSSLAKKGFVGAQISGLTNISVEKSYGLQVAGIQNVARAKLVGGQVSGIMNIANKGINFLQISGGLNSTFKNNGLQLSSLFNMAKHNHGLQVGLINLSIENKGASLGLINFVLKGYHKTEISSNTNFPLNLTLKSGTKYLYNSYHAGITFKNNTYYTFGLGLGTYFSTGEKTQISIDLSGHVLAKHKIHYNSQQYKLAINFDFIVAEWLTIFVGPTLNTGLYFETESGLEIIDLNDRYFIDYPISGYNAYAKFWFGGQIGIRL